MADMIKVEVILNENIVYIKAPYDSGFNRSLVNLFELPTEVTWDRDSDRWVLLDIEHLDMVEELMAINFPNAMINYKETNNESA